MSEEAKAPAPTPSPFGGAVPSPFGAVRAIRCHSQSPPAPHAPSLSPPLRAQPPTGDAPAITPFGGAVRAQPSPAHRPAPPKNCALTLLLLLQSATPFGAAAAPFGAPKPAAAAEDGGGDDDDNAVAPEEEAQVEFKPLVTLEEVKTSTGEEDEVHLSDPPFKIRAKLFRYESDTWNKEEKLWKERGTGDVAFLKHKETGVVRLLMRREKTKKICANFTLGSGDKAVQLKPNSGSDRSWCWSCQDFSEEKADTMSILAIRFANSENALEFKKEWLKATGATDSAADAPAPAAAAPEAAPAAAAPAAAE